MTSTGLQPTRALKLAVIGLVILAPIVGAENLSVDRFDDSSTATTCTLFLNNDCSLRGAIIRANGNGEDDTIFLSTEGTYLLTLDGYGADSGDLNITDNVTINGRGRSLVSISASGIPGGDRIITIDTGVTVTIRDITFKNGQALSIETSGGGIWNDGTLFLERVSFINNHAAILGGAIFNTSTGWLEIDNSYFFINDAGDRGGAICTYGTLRFNDSYLAFNDAGNYGGGVFVANTGSAQFNRSTCYSNAALAENGGCAYNAGSLNVVNSTICWNDAVDGLGGGVFNAGELDLTNVTFAYNDSAGDLSSAIFTTSGGPLRIGNSIIEGTCGGAAASYSSLGGNIESPGYSCPLLLGSDLRGVPDLFMGPSGYNGGALWSFPLLPESPAIDAGSNSLCPPEDQRRQPRPMDGDGDFIAQCDSGAYEFNPAEILIDGFESGDVSAWPL